MADGIEINGINYSPSYAEEINQLKTRLSNAEEKIIELEDKLGLYEKVDFTTEYDKCSFINRDVIEEPTTINIDGKGFSINSTTNHYRGDDYYAPTISIYDGVHYLRIFNRFGITTDKKISTVVITLKDKEMADNVVEYIENKGINGVGESEIYWCEVISQEENTLTIDVSNLVANSNLDYYIFGHDNGAINDRISLLIKSIKIY